MKFDFLRLLLPHMYGRKASGPMGGFLTKHSAVVAANYLRNLMVLTRVPTMTLIWVTKLFSSVPMKKPLVR
jgi:hypothetical protein